MKSSIVHSEGGRSTLPAFAERGLLLCADAEFVSTEGEEADGEDAEDEEDVEEDAEEEEDE